MRARAKADALIAYYHTYSVGVDVGEGEAANGRVWQALCGAVFASADWHDQDARRRGRRAASALILAFQVGRTVHCAADAIHTYATEIHPEYKVRLPADLLELIYFLDEDLGHWLLFIPYYCLLALLTCCCPGQRAACRRFCPCSCCCLTGGVETCVQTMAARSQQQRASHRGCRGGQE